MNGNPDVIAAACQEISKGGLYRAREIISADYPFISFASAGRNYSVYQKTKIFIKDGFIDRYSGERLVFPGALRLLSILIPEEFPFHRNWKTSACHIAYWQLLPTIDHIVPVSRGGENVEENWVCTSQLRNSAKSNWLLKELGWSLHGKGNLDKWDGMINWYISFLDTNPHYLENKYLHAWHRAAKLEINTLQTHAAS